MKSLILFLERKSIFNERLAFVRSIFALGALLTLLFNNVPELADFELLANKQDMIFVRNIPLTNFSIFYFLGLEVGKYVSILILLSVFTGFIPQVTGLLQAWVHYSICNSFLVVEGGDQIASNLTILLVLICLFDNRLNQWRPERKSEGRKPVNVFFNVYYFLIILQVAIIYLHSGIGKLYNEEWRNGTCAYYWFTHNVFGAPVWIQKIYNIFTLSKFAPLFTWSVIILELLLFACILATNRKLKYIFLIIGLIFHLSIIFTHGLVSFFCSMAAALILYLDDKNIIYLKIKEIFIKNYYGKKV
ncbi:MULTISPECIES: sporulation-delaying protein SdpB family protein [Chryseobacterium]|uniref:Antimicrobial peptide system SdpB family protein n=1 Tax=Chryseobacterium camelliae TaxID=1265445 RepID=A0ABU0TM08_9FLAO|nr:MULTISPECIES: sporulation-delaying protein SdpB family protein [Chryseobacterium]MDQ1098083.1 antimicrobial peptide system SdpB family protein [Chryseobacterium camelliae]MDR6085450.1 antimicrobial peptide system SdpB family protein [Chryseobacterium sp. SORGH_AS_0909]MDR6129814.1 antimicrobial peptide system SdpB family protein [Chryseobacterium sp. SORGH_AS_1175]MDT3408061.1 antimicrobial peptide system SdpB family protein [Pseudacidovorax intermedius]